MKKIDNIVIVDRFNFDNASDNFDEHVVKSVFSYKKFHEYIINLTKYFIDINIKNKILDLGCSTSSLINGIQKEYSNFDIDYYGVDISQKMIDFSKNKTKANFIKSDIFDYIIKDDNKYNLIISCLTMQFINLEKRKMIVKEVYKKLENFGGFILVEKCFENDSEYSNIFNREYYNFKEKNGFSAKEILEKDKSLVGIMKPLTIDENIKMLNKCGFKTYSIFLKDFNFVGILCIKKEV